MDIYEYGKNLAADGNTDVGLEEDTYKKDKTAAIDDNSSGLEWDMHDQGNNVTTDNNNNFGLEWDFNEQNRHTTDEGDINHGLEWKSTSTKKYYN